MNKEELRRVTFSNQTGYFHQWVTKVYEDQPGCQHILALIELENGNMREIHAEDIRFIE